MKRNIFLGCTLLICALTCAVPNALAGAIRNLSGFTNNVFQGNDDGTFPGTDSSGGVPQPIGFSINFYGKTYTQLYVNNNGNVTFDSPLGEYTPFGLVGVSTEIIAPFFADVDTRVGNLTTFGNDVVDGHQAFGVDWIGVGYFDQKTDKLNSFQLILIDRSDRNPGDFDIEFNYDQVQWETGDASGGQDGLGGDSAVAGFSNGSGDPGTSMQLSGSATPGSFLDINPGGLIHNSLNTNVLGRYVIPIVNLTNTVLNVQRFSQGDSRWANNTYAKSSFTIQQKGCALTSLAMALKYAGISTDPGALNTLMNANGDYSGNSVDWDPATRDASGDTLEFHAFRTSDTQFLSLMLSEGHPVIVGVNLNDEDAPGHFVLVIGEQNGKFVIDDPGHANATTLDYYNNDFETRGYVGDPAGNISGLDFIVGTAADILVVGPLGQQTGHDPSSGNILQEIPQSVHFSDCIEDNDLTGAPGSETAHIVQLYQPAQGQYQFYLCGSNSGSYDLTVRSYAMNGTRETPLDLKGTKALNVLSPGQINLGPSAVAAQTFTNLYPWTVSPTNGGAPLSVQFTAPSADNNGNTITNWFWTFGDGSISTEQSPAHTYDFGGFFYPTVTVVNALGQTIVSLGQTVLIPTIDFTATPNVGAPPLTVQFNTSNVDSTGSAIVSWSWDFGDGSTDTSQNPQHTYSGDGDYLVRLTALNAQGFNVSASGPSIAVFESTGVITNGGFETGNLFGWTCSDPNEIVVDPSFAQSGNYGVNAFPFGTLGFLSQNIPTTPGAKYLFSFWLDSDGDTPNEFTASWNGTNLVDWVDSPTMNFTNFQFTVTATRSHTPISFGFRDDGFDMGLGFDSVSVVPLSLPSPTLGISVSGGKVVLAWPTSATGFTLQSSPNLGSAAVWTPVSTPPVVVNGQNVVSNSISGNRMFFRLSNQ
ncbi:MAG TPA: nidogen-like domain-containing protein [Verrucomicrobiae bacterium]|nr:nidogen-like domain-containing protein [Verrucomicrobiae bacterium]